MRKWSSLLLLTACASGQISPPPDASLPVDAASTIDARPIDAASVVDARPIDAAGGIDARPIDAAVVIDARPIDANTVIDATPGSCDLGGWQLVQTNAAGTYTIPAGTVLAPGAALVVARNADQTAFSTYWGVTKPAAAVFINSLDHMPQLNGGETYQLKNAGGTAVEAATVAMAGSGGEDVVRLAYADPSVEGTWSRLDDTVGTPTPFTTALAGGAFAAIVEISDATGTGNYVYEFIEIRCP